MFGKMERIMQQAIYTRDDSGKWFCRSHQREATHVAENGSRSWRCCDPKLGGIMIPCDVTEKADV